MTKFRLSLFVAALAGPLLMTAPAAQAVPVGLELSLLLDVSGSVDANEYALQRGGYVQAFQSNAVQNAILTSVQGSIAVNLIQWSGVSQQVQSVGWTLINSVASANAFATAVSNVSRAFSGNTAIGTAINFAVPLFNNNGFEGARQVIDVSGDGAANEGQAPSVARNSALAAGIEQINGLPILGEGGLQAYYAANVQGGVGSFTLPANSFDTFATAIEDKLVREIRPVPEPVSLALLGIGLVGAGIVRRRRA